MLRNLVKTTLASALQRARHAGASAIRSCSIALGELVDITPETFQVEWRALARGTPAETAVLHIRRLPAELQCMTCFHKYAPAGSMPACPNCGGVGAKVLSGEDCFIDSIETD